MNSDWLNSVQEELAQTIEHAGIALDQIQKTDHTQLLQAIQKEINLPRDNPQRMRFDVPTLPFREPRETGIILDSNLTRAAHLRGVYVYANPPTAPRPSYDVIQETFYYSDKEARWNPPQFYKLDFKSIDTDVGGTIFMTITLAGHVQYLKPFSPEAGTFMITYLKEYPR
jgi:hypothetical protein